ncbi:MAG TPA: peptidoglycan DD-metalloendopeptidase family protein [Acidimicrobiia bacterium]
MRMKSAARGLAFIVSVALFGSVAQLPALSVTKSQVDAACASSSAQYAIYQEKQREADAAKLAWEQTLAEIAALEDQRAYIDESIDRRLTQIDSSADQINQLAVELYMEAGGASSTLLFAGSLDEVLTGNELLDAATGDSMAALDDLLAIRNDLDRFQGELVELDAQLRDVEAERAAFADTVWAIAEEANAEFAKLSSDCQNLTNQYNREQAAARAAAAAKAGGRSAGVGAISGFRCPIPGSSFIDSWGYPRSGGRSHKGTDMFGPWNASIIASADGVVSIREGGLGGKTIWLSADNGYGFYYAHLAGYNVSNGSRVSTGQLIGFNGDTGNARGGPPHLHFEIHPGGRGSGAVNPYPTVAAACR